MRKHNLGEGVLISTYVQRTSFNKMQRNSLLKALIDEKDLSLPKRFITYALVLRYLRTIVGRFERIRSRGQALEKAAMMFICLRTVSNGSSLSPAPKIYGISCSGSRLTKGRPQ